AAPVTGSRSQPAEGREHPNGSVGKTPSHLLFDDAGEEDGRGVVDIGDAPHADPGAVRPAGHRAVTCPGRHGAYDALPMPLAAPLLRGLVRRAGIRHDDVVAAIPVPDHAVPPYRLNRVCHPDAWDDPEWMMFNRILELPGGEDRYHRKQFEWTQCIFGLERLGALGPRARVLGIG